jgi:hypothetical protein
VGKIRNSPKGEPETKITGHFVTYTPLEDGRTDSGRLF